MASQPVSVSRFARSLSDFSALACATSGSDDETAFAIAAAAAVLEAEFDGVVSALAERQALLERLSKIQKSITRRADLQETLDAIVAGAAELLDEPIAGLRLIDEQDPGWLRLVSWVGMGADFGPEMARSPVADGVGGRAVVEERLVVDEHYQAAARPIAAVRAAGAHAAIAAPVREQARVVGSLAVASTRPERRFSSYEREALTAFAEQASIALTDARMVSDALHQAVHDALTGLPNRTLFADRVERALARARRRGGRVAVLFFDLDHFKVVNDSLGHHAGDQLLVALADRLRDLLRDSDTVARFGGDEFAVLLEDVDDGSGPVRVAESVIELLSQPIVVGGRRHVISASIGIALSGPGSSSPAALVRDADAAMYRAKLGGRNGYEVFDDRMRAHAMERLRIENELRAALEEEQFELHFQPIVDLTDPAHPICSAEALVRWRHPRRGLLGPGEFIAVAEESGLILGLGRWVLEEACRACAAWPAVDGKRVSVTVNLSPRQIGPRLIDAVAAAITDSGLDPSLLALEITEGVLLEDSDTSRATLKALRALGARLLLDDFGTGYSSLGYLRRLPLDGLKVDRSFVDGLGADEEASAIVGAIIGMATSLGLSVVAEGVETPAQLAALAELGCGLAQGYLFARPMTGDAFVAELALRSGAPWPSRRLPSTRSRSVSGSSTSPGTSAA